MLDFGMIGRLDVSKMQQNTVSLNHSFCGIDQIGEQIRTMNTDPGISRSLRFAILFNYECIPIICEVYRTLKPF